MSGLVYSPPPDAMLRAPTKTIAFTGAEGLGEAGTAVPVWTTTGRVMLIYMSAYISETLVSASDLGTISLGIVGATTIFTGASTVGSGAGAVGDWWAAGDDDFIPGAAPNLLYNLAMAGVPISANIIISPATQNITDGTLVMDCFYIPLSAGASLT